MTSRQKKKDRNESSPCTETISFLRIRTRPSAEARYESLILEWYGRAYQANSCRRITLYHRSKMSQLTSFFFTTLQHKYCFSERIISVSYLLRCN